MQEITGFKFSSEPSDTGFLGLGKWSSDQINNHNFLRMEARVFDMRDLYRYRNIHKTLAAQPQVAVRLQNLYDVSGLKYPVYGFNLLTGGIHELANKTPADRTIISVGVYQGKHAPYFSPHAEILTTGDTSVMAAKLILNLDRSVNNINATMHQNFTDSIMQLYNYLIQADLTGIDVMTSSGYQMRPQISDLQEAS